MSDESKSVRRKAVSGRKRTPRKVAIQEPSRYCSEPLPRYYSEDDRGYVSDHGSTSDHRPMGNHGSPVTAHDVCARRHGHPGAHTRHGSLAVLLDALGREETLEDLIVLTRAENPPKVHCKCANCVPLLPS